MEVLLWVEDLTPYLSIFWEILKVGTSDCQEFIPGCSKRKRVTSSTTTRRLWLHSSWHSCLPFQDIHSHIPESTSEAGLCASRGQCLADAVSQTLLISPPGAIPLWQEHRAALFLGCHSGKFTALFTYGKHLENAIDWLSEAWDGWKNKLFTGGTSLVCYKQPYYVVIPLNWIGLMALTFLSQGLATPSVVFGCEITELALVLPPTRLLMCFC